MGPGSEHVRRTSVTQEASYFLLNASYLLLHALYTILFSHLCMCILTVKKCVFQIVMHYQHIFQSTPFLMDFIYLITALSSGGHFKLVILEF